jgi:hypothetical protein
MDPKEDQRKNPKEDQRKNPKEDQRKNPKEDQRMDPGRTIVIQIVTSPRSECATSVSEPDRLSPNVW